MNFVNNLRVLLIAGWLGAATFFVIVAGISFNVLPTRDLAGSIVNRTLSVINYSGLLIGLILLFSSFINKKSVILWIERSLLIILSLCCAVGQFIIGYQMSQLRQQMGRPIDELALDEPLRVAFNSLHQYSVWILTTGMIIALITFFIITKKQKDKKQEYGTN